MIGSEWKVEWRSEVFPKLRQKEKRKEMLLGRSRTLKIPDQGEPAKGVRFSWVLHGMAGHGKRARRKCMDVRVTGMSIEVW